MAPWPNRVASLPRPDTRSSHRQTASNVSTSSARTPLRTPELGFLDTSQLQAESSSSDSEVHPQSRPQRPSHTRSLSHPFPSIFSSRKKKQNKTTSGYSGSESDDDGVPLTRSGRKLQQNMPKTIATTSHKDFATGTCMTCGSLVRWPRELAIFKCTICLTINDLVPQHTEVRTDDTNRARLKGLPQRPGKEPTHGTLKTSCE